MEQTNCGGCSPEVGRRAQAWLSCAVLSPASEPITVCVVVVEVASSTHSWFSMQPEKAGRERGGLEPGAGWRIPGCCLYGPSGCLEHTLGVTNDVISFVWEN